MFLSVNAGFGPEGLTEKAFFLVSKNAPFSQGTINMKGITDNGNIRSEEKCMQQALRKVACPSGEGDFKRVAMSVRGREGGVLFPTNVHTRGNFISRSIASSSALLLPASAEGEAEIVGLPAYGGKRHCTTKGLVYNFYV